jgi:translation initiation factor 2 subunit 2
MEKKENIKKYDVDYLIERLYVNLGTIQQPQGGIPKPKIKNQDKKTYILNFREICQKMDRAEFDVQQFFGKETGQSVSVSADGQLVIQSIIRSPKPENIMKGYIIEYVQCKMCKSTKTNIIKKNKLSILNCDICHADRALESS